MIATKPVLIEKIWGTARLGVLKGSASEKKIGESWEVSTLAEGNSLPDTNIVLDYLIKFIDTSDHLSVQVHPGDEYAKLHENSSGKNECWLILESEPGCGIYLGFKSGVTKEQFQKGLQHNEDMSQYLNFYPTTPGDFFYVPAGAVHAIGKGVMLAEVQQSSGITYRVWDWNRVGDDGKPRELHVNKAMDVLNFDKRFNQELEKNHLSSLLNTQDDTVLVNNEYFKLSLIYINGERDIAISKLSSILTLSVGVSIDGKLLAPYSSCLFESKDNIQFSANRALILFTERTSTL